MIRCRRIDAHRSRRRDDVFVRTLTFETVSSLSPADFRFSLSEPQILRSWTTLRPFPRQLRPDIRHRPEGGAVLPHEALLEIDTRPEEALEVDQVRYRVEEALVEALNQPMTEIVASALYPFIGRWSVGWKPAGPSCYEPIYRCAPACRDRLMRNSVISVKVSRLLPRDQLKALGSSVDDLKHSTLVNETRPHAGTSEQESRTGERRAPERNYICSFASAVL
jgi:hypothetical protein